MFYKRSMLALACGLMLAMLAGCSTLTSWFGEDSGAGAKTAIQFATLKVIDEDPDRASRVVEIVGDVRSLVSDSATTSLDEIEARVREEIDWSRLDTAEQLVVGNLIDAVRAEITDRIDQGTLEPDERVAVGNVLDWIREAAVMAGGATDVAGAQTATRTPVVSLGRGAGEAFAHRWRAPPRNHRAARLARPARA